MWQMLVIGLIGLSPTAADPLIPVPEGCSAPLQPHVVFIGEVIDRDYRTVRFEIDRIRAGDPAPFGFDGDEIDVRYGLDAQYLDDGDTYLVSAVVHPDLGLLTSRVTDPIEHFGGDEVIGVSETDVDCPVFEDAARTLHVDGTPVDASLLEPFFGAKPRIVAALVIPPAVALGVIFALATFRLSVTGLFNSIFRPTRR
jgi:hypothetical protein